MSRKSLSLPWVKPKSQEWTVPKPISRLRVLLGAVVPAFFVVVGAVGAGLAGDYKDLSSIYTKLGITAVVVSALFVGWWDARGSRKASRDEVARAEYIIKFNDRLDGIVNPLVDLAQSDRSAENCRYFISHVLTAGSQLFPEDGIRLCLYEFESHLDESESGGAGNGSENRSKKQYLTLVASHGRQDEARPAFYPEDSWGQHAIEIAKGHVAKPFTNIPFSDPGDTNRAIDRQVGASWTSFMQFPIRGRESKDELGALMIDARENVRWTTEHQAIGTTIAKVLARGLEYHRDAARDVRPESSRARSELAALNEA